MTKNNYVLMSPCKEHVNRINISNNQTPQDLVHQMRRLRDKVALLLSEEETKPEDVTSETEPCNIEEDS